MLSVRALRIAEDGEDYATTVRVMLRDLAGDATSAGTLWKALVTEGQRLAEERAPLGEHRGELRHAVREQVRHADLAVYPGPGG